MTSENLPFSDLQKAKKLLYDRCGFKQTDLQRKSESAEYSACSFCLDDMKIEYRRSKITPTKTGQFVTIWKRDADGKTAPFEISDDFDFIVITSNDGDRFGQFIFPKAVLADKGIISQKGKVGKRGIRVYPPWNPVTSRQAEKTQSWQTQYFVEIKPDGATDLNFARKLFSKEKQ